MSEQLALAEVYHCPPEARPLLLRRPEAFVLAWGSCGQDFLREDVGASVVSAWDIVKKVPYT